jgi:hypothetical protein
VKMYNKLCAYAFKHTDLELTSLFIELYPGSLF